jgi:hypothetical protein
LSDSLTPWGGLVFFLSGKSKDDDDDEVISLRFMARKRLVAPP